MQICATVLRRNANPNPNRNPRPFEPQINRLRGLLLCRVSRHSVHGFSSYRANKHTSIHTHTVRDKVTAMSAQPHHVFGADLRNLNSHVKRQCVALAGAVGPYGLRALLTSSENDKHYLIRNTKSYRSRRQNSVTPTMISSIFRSDSPSDLPKPAPNRTVGFAQLKSQ